MSEEEVLAAFGGEAQRITPERYGLEGDRHVARIGINAVLVGGVRLRARFLFAASAPEKGLAKVILRSADDSPITLNSQFVILKELLAAKYGAPTSEDDSRSPATSTRTRTAMWHLRKTAIRLDFFNMSGPIPVSSLVVVYTPIARADLDNL